MVNTALQSKSISATASKGHHKFTLTVTENSVNSADNTSSVAWEFAISAVGNGGYDWNFNSTTAATYTVTVDGTSYTGKLQNYDGKSTITFDSMSSMAVGHNSDGSKTLNFSFSVSSNTNYSYLPGTASASGSMALTLISKASQPSCVTWPEHTQNVGEFGNTIAIHMNRTSSSFTHTVRYAFGSLTGTIATGVTTGTTWTIPLSFMSLLPANTSGSGTIYVDTYNGSTFIGTKWCGFTATVPASVKPTCSIQVLDATNTKDTYGNLVKGLSQLYVKTTGTPAYSSPVSKYNVIANGVTYSKAEITTGVLSSSGTTTVKATVTDQRGRTSEQKSASFTVLDYNKPSISALQVRRSNSDGTTNDRGTHVKVTFSASVTSLSSKNTATYSLQYKKSSETSWKTIALTSYANKYSVTDGTYIFEASGSSPYDVKITATDRHYSTSRSTSASTDFTVVHYNKDGDGLAFGAVIDEANTLTNDLALWQRNNRYSFQPGSFSGAGGYTALATITLTNIAANSPITFVITKRNSTAPMTCHLAFKGSSNANMDVDLQSFYYEGDNYGAFMCKSATQTWTLYVDNTGGWSNPCLQDWYTSKSNAARVKVTFPAEQVTTLPSPYYRATPLIPQNILDSFMPVGYVLILYSHADPNDMYPGTTWVRIQNAFLWAVDSVGTIGQTGGAKEVTLTTANLPSHNHGIAWTDSTGSVGNEVRDNPMIRYAESNKGYAGAVTTSVGSGTAHNNMPPYIQVSVWRRTV